MTAAAITTIQRKPNGDIADLRNSAKLAADTCAPSDDDFNYNKIRVTYFCYRISTGCLVSVCDFVCSSDSFSVQWLTIQLNPLYVVEFFVDPIHVALYGEANYITALRLQFIISLLTSGIYSNTRD